MILLYHSTWVHDVGQTGIAAVRVVVRICAQQILVNWICHAGDFAREGKTERASRCVARFYWLFLRARARADDPYVSLSKDRFLGETVSLRLPNLLLRSQRTVVSL